MSAAPGTLEALRRAFDSAFAVEFAAATERVDLVALRAGGRSFAVRVSDVAGVVTFRGVAPVPCDEPAMLGLAAVRGAPLPVYDLAALLGDGSAQAPRWMLLSAGTNRVALAFDEIEEYLRVPREQLIPASQGGRATPSAASELVRTGSSVRPVVSMSSLLKELEQRLGAR
jgi:purine-binding chemotaxis protein CheW